MPRQTDPRGFNPRAARVVSDPGLSAAEVARRLGTRDNPIRNGERAASRAPAPPPGKATRHRPRTSGGGGVARLEAERDLLADATAYLASPPT